MAPDRIRLLFCNLLNLSAWLHLAKIQPRQVLAIFISLAMTTSLTTSSYAQQSAPSAPPVNSAENGPATDVGHADTVTVPAGTRFTLVLTNALQTRYLRRGDDIYAQITSPVTSGNSVVVPPGTFVQGKLDKIERHGGRGVLHLQSLTITFPDGYVAPVAGPVDLVSDDGYAMKDPGQGRMAAVIVGPMAGAGLGALIGHAAASGNSSTLTSTLPPGCTGPPPGCLSTSMSVPGSKAKGTVIGAAVGSAIGLVASFALIASSHNFYLEVGAPVEMVLRQPLTMDRNQDADSVEQYYEDPVPTQPIAPLPLPQPLPTPDIVIPGVPPSAD